MSFRTINQVKADYNIGKKPKLFPIQSTENALNELEHENKRKTRMRSKLGQAIESMPAIPIPKPKPIPRSVPTKPTIASAQKPMPSREELRDNEMHMDKIDSQALDFDSLLKSYYEEL